MPMNVEAEIRELKRRVGEIEGSFGFLTEQTRGVHQDLLAFQARTEQRFDKVDGRLDKVDGGLDRVEGRLGRVEKGLRICAKTCPELSAPPCARCSAKTPASRARSREQAHVASLVYRGMILPNPSSLASAADVSCRS